MSSSQNPDHYKLMGGYSCDDVMRSCMTPEEYRGYWRGCVLKYVTRLGRKDSEADAATDAAKLAECARRLELCYKTGDENEY